MVDRFSRLYVVRFSKGFFSRINDFLLNLTLRARGYNNFRNNKESGESFFIEKFSRQAILSYVLILARYGNYSKELLEKTNAKVIALSHCN